jgi:hypothetical protein
VRKLAVSILVVLAIVATGMASLSVWQRTQREEILTSTMENAYFHEGGDRKIFRNPGDVVAWRAVWSWKDTTQGLSVTLDAWDRQKYGYRLFDLTVVTTQDTLEWRREDESWYGTEMFKAWKLTRGSRKSEKVALAKLKAQL